MQTFENILILLKTGNKQGAINDYAETMGISKEEATKAIETLLANVTTDLAVKGKTEYEKHRR